MKDNLDYVQAITIEMLWITNDYFLTMKHTPWNSVELLLIIISVITIVMDQQFKLTEEQLERYFNELEKIC